MITKDFTKSAFLAALMLVLVLTFSCSSGGSSEDGLPSSVDGSGLSSSSVETSSSSYDDCFVTNSIMDCSTIQIPSSSSVGLSSSSSLSSSSFSVIYGETVTYGGEDYPTIVIGTQTWFAKNLNYDAEGSKCINDDTANCVKFGRLYDWAMAMALPSECNNIRCTSQINEKHQGVCPSSWHIPSNNEWTALTNYIGLTNAGTKLKAASSWDSFSGVPIGTDLYGFAGLASGNIVNGNSINVGLFGFWWLSTEGNSGESGGAYFKRLAYWGESLEGQTGGNKNNMYSVRCVKD